MLEGKVALITGCATGIGKSIAHSMAKEKANIIIHYIVKLLSCGTCVNEVINGQI